MADYDDADEGAYQLRLIRYQEHLQSRAAAANPPSDVSGSSCQ